MTGLYVHICKYCRTPVSQDEKSEPLANGEIFHVRCKPQEGK